MNRESPSTLETRWAALQPPVGVQLTGERLSQWSGGAIVVAVDSSEMRHLLVQVPGPSTARRPLPQLRGLVVQQRRLRIGTDEGTWLDVCLTDDRSSQAFTLLCAEILEDAEKASEPEAAVILETIDRWRRFWTNDSSSMSDESRLGLFGELWLLAEWLPLVNRAAVSAWRGPLGGRHDFVTPSVSVEVKCTGRATGPVLHKVGSLDQLAAPVTGELFLLSLRIIRDPLGGNSLAGLIEQVRSAVAESEDILRDLDQRIAAAGWVGARDSVADESVRVAVQQLFRVDASFPRLTPETFPGGVPAGISEVGYTLDTSALSEWMVAQRPRPVGPLAVLADGGLGGVSVEI